jgi:glycosyltransferase involved in cell wall biosynthesis
MAQDKFPLVSIITACRNSARFLEGAIGSVLAQTYPRIEYIIIDGASTDGTLDIIYKYENRLGFWKSEPDRCYAEAWNKGIRAAKGDIVGILNADDEYERHAVEQVVAGLSAGDRAVSYGVTRFIGDKPGEVLEEENVRFNAAMLSYGFGFYHTTCFVTKRVYDEIGIFDSRYRVAADTDFLLRCYRHGVEFRRLKNVTGMRLRGLSMRRDFAAKREFYGQLWKYGIPKSSIIRAAFFSIMHKLLPPKDGVAGLLARNRRTFVISPPFPPAR